MKVEIKGREEGWGGGDGKRKRGSCENVRRAEQRVMHKGGMEFAPKQAPRRMHSCQGLSDFTPLVSTAQSVKHERKVWMESSVCGREKKRGAEEGQ